MIEAPDTKKRIQIYTKAIEIVGDNNTLSKNHTCTCKALFDQLMQFHCGLYYRDMSEFFPEFVMFQPEYKTTRERWFETRLERQIALEFCIQITKDK
jgi:hypothetical protein